MRFGSVCSGIEAASVAWEPLGFKAAWLAEIEKWPSAFLAERYPDVPNYGDMTALPDMIRLGLVEAPELFCGGTPCQAFSVAGLRKSLGDHRGNLSLIFCEIANVIDSVRTEPAIIFWENVPGVLNTSDNAFGCFLAGLAGEDDPLVAPGGRWSNAGCVFGPKRTVAWRVLDAQYFGVAQRRRRVFVVASAREGFDPCKVLFESEGVRRDITPSREAGQDTTGSTGDGLARCVTAGEAKRQDCMSPNLVAHGWSEELNALEECQPTLQRGGAGGRHEGVAYSTKLHNTQSNQAGKFYENYTASLDANSPPPAVIHGTQDPCVGDIAFAQGRNSGGENVLIANTQVRRLTPIECERLQGFPDGYTDIGGTDGHRYKALGNSWAVPVVRWIGLRIALLGAPT